MHDNQPSLTVISLVAKREGIDPMNLTPPLYDAIDPSALDRLFQNKSGTQVITVIFSYKGYTITVDSTGHVDIDADMDS